MFNRRLFHWMLPFLCGSTLALAGYEAQKLTEVAPVMAAEAVQLGDCYAPPRNLKLIPPAEMYLDITNNTDESIRYISELTHDRGGYCIVSNTWSQGEYKFTTLILTVPMRRFEDVQQAIQGRGHLTIGKIPDELQSTISPSRDWETFVEITLYLRPILTEPISNVEPAPKPVPPVPIEPSSAFLDTFQNAFNVTSTIFTYLFKLAIWIVVVPGPFIVIGLVGRWLYNRYWPWGIIERPIGKLVERDEPL